MAPLTLKSPEQVLREMGRRARGLRLYRNLTQAELAARADVAVRTLQRFENTGRASTELVVRIAFALGAEQPMESLFQRPEPASIDEFLADSEPGRQRARGSK